MIEWPEEYSPERTAVHVHNELEMPVPPERVWAWLVRADIWPTWFQKVQNVAVRGGGRELQQGSVFSWRTSGVSLESKVEEFVPCERLSWSARGMGIDAFHVWLIEKTPTGCHVVTDENQKGWLARLSSVTRPNNMSRFHQAWLQGLLEKAKAGLPP